jgi:hypothetical protein
MARWLTLQLGGGMIDGRRVVGAGPLDETHRPTSTLNYNPQSGAISFYGLGWNVRYDDAGRRRLSHSGAFGLGAATAVSAIPAEQVGIVVLTNGAPVGAAEAISESFMEVALTGRLERDYLALFGPFFDALAASPYGNAADYQTPLAQAAPALPLAAYVGTYGNSYAGQAEVTAGPNGLVLHLGPAQTPYPMWHWDRDVFLYQPVGENAHGPSAVTFSVGPDRVAQRMVIEILAVEDVGGGTLTRVEPGAPR